MLYQYARRLAEKEETDHSAVFIDSTKFESKMGGYTFVWKETTLKHRDKVKAELKKLTNMETTPEVVGCYPDGNSTLILVCARLAMLPERRGDARNI